MPIESSRSRRNESLALQQGSKFQAETQVEAWPLHQRTLTNHLRCSPCLGLAVESFLGSYLPLRPPRRLLSRHLRSEEHTSELQSIMRISYAVFCLKKQKS